MNIGLSQHPSFPSLFADGSGWNAEHYRRLMTVACQGQVVVLGRGSAVMYVGRYHSFQNEWRRNDGLAFVTDGGGWTNPVYHSTIRCIEFRGKVYVVARGSVNLHLVNYDPETDVWKPLKYCEAFGDADGYYIPSAYETFRATVLDERLWVFIRGSKGFRLAAYHFDSNSWECLPRFSWLTDTQGFSDPRLYRTIQFAGIDHKLCILVRTPNGMQAATFFPSESRLEFAPMLPLFADEDGGSLPECYESIRTHVVDRKWFLCGYAYNQLHLAYFDVESGRWSLLQAKEDFLRGCGDRESCYKSLRFLSFSSFLLVVCRGVNCTLFVTYNLVTRQWGNVSTDAWLSDSTFDSPAYYASFQAVSIGEVAYVVIRAPSEIKLAKIQVATPK